MTNRPQPLSEEEVERISWRPSDGGMVILYVEERDALIESVRALHAEQVRTNIAEDQAKSLDVLAQEFEKNLHAEREQLILTEALVGLMSEQLEKAEADLRTARELLEMVVVEEPVYGTGDISGAESGYRACFGCDMDAKDDGTPFPHDADCTYVRIRKFLAPPAAQEEQTAMTGETRPAAGHGQESEG